MDNSEWFNGHFFNIFIVLGGKHWWSFDIRWSKPTSGKLFEVYSFFVWYKGVDNINGEVKDVWKRK